MRNRPNVTLNELTQLELETMRRYIEYPKLLTVARSINGRLRPLRPTLPSCELYPCKDFTVKVLSSLSSKFLRENLIKEEEVIICDYRSGIILTPGEVLNWTSNVKRLTSTKHRNCLLRIAHGDVYTNDRLFRFGLNNEPKCVNCNSLREDLRHRLIECTKAREAWELLERILVNLGYLSITLSLEGVIGAGEDNRTPKLALTLRAELASRLMAKGGSIYNPRMIVAASLRTILTVEKMPTAKSREIRAQLEDLTES